MRRSRELEGAQLWAVVTATVRPLAQRPVAEAIAADDARPRPGASLASAPASPPPTAPKRVLGPIRPIEPGRRRGFERRAGILDGRIDLHGHNQESARGLLTRFILARHGEGGRSILVITGKGAWGEGVLRRRVPDWLAQPPLRDLVAGISDAHRRHGGEGALYVALKRKSPV